MIVAALHDAEERAAVAREDRPAPGGPARRPRHRRLEAAPLGGERRTVVEGHGDVAAERLLDRHAALGRHHQQAAVQVRAEGDAVLGEGASVAQAEDLEAAAVGQERARPVHEAVQAAEPSDHLLARPQGQVVGVPQNHVEAQVLHVLRSQALDRPGRAHRHERRRLDRAVRGRDPAAPRGAARIAGEDAERERRAHRISIASP